MTVTNQPASNTAFSELEQLRLIIFGDAQRVLEQKISQLSNDLNDQFNELKTEQKRHSLEIKEMLEKAVESLSDKLDFVDSQHDEKHQTMVATTETLNAQLELSDASGKDEVDALHKRLDEEVQKLNSLFSNKHAEAMAKLAKVSHELTDTKTDRKTLAKLLATMATNLESD